MALLGGPLVRPYPGCCVWRGLSLHARPGWRGVPPRTHVPQQRNSPPASPAWGSPACPTLQARAQTGLYEAGLWHSLPRSSGHFRAAVICTKAIKSRQPVPGAEGCILPTCEHRAVRGPAVSWGSAPGAGGRPHPRALLTQEHGLSVRPSLRLPLRSPGVQPWSSFLQLVGHGSPSSCPLPGCPAPLLDSAGSVGARQPPRLAEGGPWTCPQLYCRGSRAHGGPRPGDSRRLRTARPPAPSWLSLGQRV